MSDLLKEAIADAKAVRETALQNAKLALEEAFTPQLKSMLSAKLKEDDMEDEFGDEEEMGLEPEVPAEEGYYEDEEIGDEEVPEVPAEEPNLSLKVSSVSPGIISTQRVAYLGVFFHMLLQILRM